MESGCLLRTVDEDGVAAVQDATAVGADSGITVKARPLWAAAQGPPQAGVREEERGGS